MTKLDRPRHDTAGCPCGHGQHTAEVMVAPVRDRGRIAFGPTPTRRVTIVRCPECDAIERRDSVKLTFLLARRVDELMLRPGMRVQCAGSACEVASVEPVMKLKGKTRFVRVALRRSRG